MSKITFLATVAMQVAEDSDMMLLPREEFFQGVDARRDPAPGLLPLPVKIQTWSTPRARSSLGIARWEGGGACETASIVPNLYAIGVHHGHHVEDVVAQELDRLLRLRQEAL